GWRWLPQRRRRRRRHAPAGRRRRQGRGQVLQPAEGLRLHRPRRWRRGCVRAHLGCGAGKPHGPGGRSAARVHPGRPRGPHLGEQPADRRRADGGGAQRRRRGTGRRRARCRRPAAAADRRKGQRHREVLQCHEGLRLHPARRRTARCVRAHLGRRARRHADAQRRRPARIRAGGRSPRQDRGREPGAGAV
ncbi:MAG: Cold shock protein of CSP family _ dimer, partial [uncultured Sphingomonas sp.]